MSWIYQIEQFKWEDRNCYHLIDSKVFESNKLLKDMTYYKNGSYFTIMRLDDEVQIKSVRRTKQRTKS